ncbi:MAG: HEAT repeat domain-containing protein [Phycisphaerae bacterium]
MQTHFTRSAPGFLWRYVPSLALLSMALSAPAATGQPSSGAPADDQPTIASLFGDFLHYARMGRFDLADASAEQLLGHPDLDAVKVLEAANQDRRSLDTLLMIIRNSDVGANATRVLELIQEGERQLRQDPKRIKDNIEKLAGPPQSEYYATQRLIESGEYAVPWMINVLLDDGRKGLHGRIASALPKLGKAALNPLVAALAMENRQVQDALIRALGEIGYCQAVPYLRQVGLDPEATEATLKAVHSAIQRIESRSGQRCASSPADGFLALANQYYDEHGSVKSDPRLPQANVWYWNPQTQFAEATPVPQAIFGAVMAMRCCEESLRIAPSNDQAIALWLAADIRRESRLGMDVERAEQVEVSDPDNTRPTDFPRSLYFARAAGARYAHLVLARALADRDPDVALGAIAALQSVAGSTSLVGTEDYKQPLVQALEFPDRKVRIRAALALGNALPKQRFVGDSLVVPVLAGALTEGSASRFVVVDVDADNRNRVAAALRQEGAEVVAEASFYKAMDRARTELQSVTGFFLATDLEAPGLGTAVASLGDEFLFARTPIVVLAKTGGVTLADQLASAGATVTRVDSRAEGSELLDALEQLREASGEHPLDSDLARALSLEAADTLLRIALDGQTVFHHSVAESSLIAALARGDEELSNRCLSVLALICSPSAQQAVAELALADTQSDTLRLTAMRALSESAKRCGHRLGVDLVKQLIQLVKDENDPVLRAVSSQALGALDLSDNQASEIIRSHHRG